MTKALLIASVESEESEEGEEEEEVINGDRVEGEGIGLNKSGSVLTIR